MSGLRVAGITAPVARAVVGATQAVVEQRSRDTVIPLFWWNVSTRLTRNGRLRDADEQTLCAKLEFSGSGWYRVQVRTTLVVHRQRRE